MAKISLSLMPFLPPGSIVRLFRRLVCPFVPNDGSLFSSEKNTKPEQEEI
jgi:hypothetical protein